jgi:hypothetical protein
MNIGAAKGYHSFTGMLVQSLLDNQKAQTELAMKTIEVAAKQQMALQQQQTALFAVALLTGVGSKLDIFI